MFPFVSYMDKDGVRYFAFSDGNGGFDVLSEADLKLLLKYSKYNGVEVLSGVSLSDTGELVYDKSKVFAQEEVDEDVDYDENIDEDVDYDEDADINEDADIDEDEDVDDIDEDTEDIDESIEDDFIDEDTEEVFGKLEKANLSLRELNEYLNGVPELKQSYENYLSENGLLNTVGNFKDYLQGTYNVNPDILENFLNWYDTNGHFARDLLYKIITPEQKDLLTRYSLWLSRQIFESDSQRGQTMKTRLKPAMYKLKKSKLDALIGNHTWEYAGYFYSPEVTRCRLNHKIHNVHLAWASDVKDFDSSILRSANFTSFVNDVITEDGSIDEEMVSENMAQNKGSVEVAIQEGLAKGYIIQFGSQCVGDFFDLDKTQLSQLLNASSKMEKDYNYILGILKSSRKDQIMNTFKPLQAIMGTDRRTLKKLSLKLVLSGAVTKEALDSQTNELNTELLNYYYDFTELGLPYPQTLIQMLELYLTGDKPDNYGSIVNHYLLGKKPLMYDIGQKPAELAKSIRYNLQYEEFFERLYRDAYIPLNLAVFNNLGVVMPCVDIDSLGFIDLSVKRQLVPLCANLVRILCYECEGIYAQTPLSNESRKALNQALETSYTLPEIKNQTFVESPELTANRNRMLDLQSELGIAGTDWEFGSSADSRELYASCMLTRYNNYRKNYEGMFEHRDDDMYCLNKTLKVLYNANRVLNSLTGVHLNRYSYDSELIFRQEA